MKHEALAADLLGRFEGLAQIDSWGEAAFFYNPARLLPRGVYFATIKLKDGANDQASRLSEGRWRFNFAMDIADFADLFGLRPRRPAKGGVVEGPWDFRKTDQLQPHPIYGWMGWAAVLNPSEAHYLRLIPLLHRAHARAQTLFEKRNSR